MIVERLWLPVTEQPASGIATARVTNATATLGPDGMPRFSIPGRSV